MPKYHVALIRNGKLSHWLSGSGKNGRGNNICTNPLGALAFETYDEAADEAGRAMDRSEVHGSEFRAVADLGELLMERDALDQKIRSITKAQIR